MRQAHLVSCQKKSDGTYHSIAVIVRLFNMAICVKTQQKLKALTLLSTFIVLVKKDTHSEYRRKAYETTMLMSPIVFSPMTKAPTPNKNKTKTPPKLDYTTIADRLRTVRWSNNSNLTGVVKPVYERSTFPLTATAV